MTDPVIASGEPIDADGRTFSMREWAHGPMPGPPVHVHHTSDEAWHVLEGTMWFLVGDRRVEVGPGATVFVPAGVPHSFGAEGPGDVRYLIIATPEIFELIDAVQGKGQASPDELQAVFRRFSSEIVV